VRFRVDGSTGWTSAETRNVGVGGAYIACANAPAVGTALVVEITLPTSDQAFPLPALVRWTTASEGGGMGVQFVDVDVDVLLEMNDYFASLTGT
jgi:hypothetical protein